MPTLSLISFDHGSFSRGFTLVNHAYSDHLAIAPGPADSIQVRPDNEIVISLQQIQLTLIRATGPTVVDAITRRKLPYRGHDSARRDDLFVRVGAPVTGGSACYYLAFALDEAGRLRAWVDGWSFEADRAAGVAEGIEGLVSQGVDMMQEFVDQAVSDVEDLVFTSIYLLPGAGTREPGRHRGDTGVALALIPVMWW